LKDSRDALYIFAAVAVGFAAGIYRLDVGLIASVVFILLEVLTWRTDLGADRRSADELPKEKKKDKGKPKTQDTDPDARDVVLRVQVTDAERARQAVEPLLEALTKTWRRAAVTSGGDGAAPL